MKIKLTIAILFLANSFANCQVTGNRQNFWLAKEFSKEVALFNTKNYLFKNVLGSSSEVVQFEVLPLAAAKSGELTTLLYKCDNKQKEGMVLGFYGDYWNDAGVVYQGFGFKNFEKTKTLEFLQKIQEAIDNNSKFLKKDGDNNNVFFKYDDIEVLIWASNENYTIRLFWNGFDSTWEKTAFDRSKKRFEKKI
jgi:hypothetical protein